MQKINLIGREWVWTRSPSACVCDGKKITVTTAPHTDLWQRTYYGFCNDNAPVLQSSTEEQFFSFTVKTHFKSVRRFDQRIIVFAERSAEVLRRIPGQSGDFFVGQAQFFFHLCSIELCHMQMVGAVIADYMSAFGDFLDHFGIMINPEPDQEKRSARAVLLENVHNLSGFVRSPRRVETQSNDVLVCFDAVNRHFAALRRTRYRPRHPDQNAQYRNQANQRTYDGNTFFPKNRYHVFTSILLKLRERILTNVV